MEGPRTRTTQKATQVDFRWISALCIVTDSASGRHQLLKNGPFSGCECGGNSRFSPSLLQQQGNWIVDCYYYYIFFESCSCSALDSEHASTSQRRQLFRQLECSDPLRYVT